MLRWVARAVYPARRQLNLLLGLMVTIGFAGSGISCAKPSEEPAVLAVVNGKSLTEQELDYRWSELTPTTQARYRREGGKRKFLDEMITRELMLQEARKRGLDQTLSMRERLARMKEQVLLDELMRQVATGTEHKVQISPEELETSYLAHAGALLAHEQIRLAHIVVTTLEQAKEVKQFLDQNYDFGKMAQRYSTDSTTKNKGGDLGIYRRGVMESEVEPVLLKLKAGKVSDPVKTASGFHLIKVLSREVLDAQEAHAARERLHAELQAEKTHKRFEEFVAKLKSSAIVRIADASRLVAEETRSVPSSSP
jgi:peptidyl-prolyl cis-trans isomerase C